MIIISIIVPLFSLIFPRVKMKKRLDGASGYCMCYMNLLSSHTSWFDLSCRIQDGLLPVTQDANQRWQVLSNIQIKRSEKENSGHGYSSVGYLDKTGLITVILHLQWPKNQLTFTDIWLLTSRVQLAFISESTDSVYQLSLLNNFDLHVVALG